MYTKIHPVTPTARAAHARKAREDHAALPRCDMVPPEEQLAKQRTKLTARGDSVQGTFKEHPVDGQMVGYNML